MYGPPIVGKTILSKQICEAYGLMYVSLETAAQDVMEDLVSDDQAFFSHNYCCGGQRFLQGCLDVLPDYKFSKFVCFNSHFPYFTSCFSKTSAT